MGTYGPQGAYSHKINNTDIHFFAGFENPHSGKRSCDVLLATKNSASLKVFSDGLNTKSGSAQVTDGVYSAECSCGSKGNPVTCNF